MGSALSNGIIVADPSLLHCVGPCTDGDRPVIAAAGTQVYFFDDGVPVGRAEGGPKPIPLPAGADHVVAERRFGLWTGRAFLEHAVPDLEDPPQSTMPQLVDVQIDPADEHFTDIHFVVHVKVPRSDVRGRAYLDDGYSLGSLVSLLAPLSIDGARISLARDLGVDSLSLTLTPASFAMDVRGSLVQANSAAAHGVHRITIGSEAENPLDVHVSLRGEHFANVHPFDRAPNAIAGSSDASWTRLGPADVVAVRVEPVAAVPFPQRARTFVAGINASSLALLLFLLVVAWQIVGILATIRLTPFGERGWLVRAAFALVSTCASFAFAALALVLGSMIQGGAPPLLVAVLGVMAMGLVYALATPSERAMIGSRPVIAIATIFVVIDLAFVYEVALVKSPAAWIGESFLSPATFVLVSVVGLIALAPRLLILAAQLKPRSARIVYCACVCFIVLSAALWRPLYPADAAHFYLPIALGEPYRAGIEALGNCVVIALPIVGLLALVGGSRGRRYTNRSVTYAGIIVLMALWCVGIDGIELAFPPALIALATIPLFALRPRAVCDALSRHLQPLGPTSETLFREAALRADLDVAARTVRQLREKFLAGDLDFAVYNTRSLELTQFIVEESRGLTPVVPEVGAPTMFAAFTMRDPLRSARLASCIGALLSAATIFVGFDVVKDTLSAASLPAMYLLAWSLRWVAHGAVAAFVFVYFLPYLRGGMATTKGLFLGLALIVAIAPTVVLLLPWNHAVALLITAGLFFPVVGAALDTIGLVQHAESVSMMRLFSFANFRTVVAIGGVLTASITNVVTGELNQAAASLVGVAVHAPGPAAGGGGPLARAP